MPAEFALDAFPRTVCVDNALCLIPIHEYLPKVPWGLVECIHAPNDYNFTNVLLTKIYLLRFENDNFELYVLNLIRRIFTDLYNKSGVSYIAYT